jgi:SET domain-containing protein
VSRDAAGVGGFGNKLPCRAIYPNAAAVSETTVLYRAADSRIHGRGVYARVAIPSETRIIEYLGERITKAEARRREAQRLERQRKGQDACVYIFELNQRHDLDGRHRGNVARLINHSCAPNCRADAIRGRIWIVARRDISAGEELTFDYGYAYKEWPLHPCRCGARNCVGYIVNKPQRWRVRKILRERRNQIIEQRPGD